MKDNCHNPIGQVLGTSPVQMQAGSTALLVVDMQYFDADRDEGEGRTAKELGVERYFEEYFSQIDAVIPRIQQLLTLFRHKGMEVIHIRVSELTEDSRDVGRKQLVRGFVVPAGSREADFLDDLQPMGDELIVNKSSSGVFPVTNFDRLLRNMGITTLVFTGTSTNGCVESAVRDAVDLGYDVVVVSDACAAGTIETHELAICYLEGALTHILSTDQIVDLIDPLEAVGPEVKSGLERVKPYLPKPPDDTDSADKDPYDAILPPALQLPLAQSNTALVLVDGQRFTCDPALGLGALAAGWRSRGVVVGVLWACSECPGGYGEIAAGLSRARCPGDPRSHGRKAARRPGSEPQGTGPGFRLWARQPRGRVHARTGAASRRDHPRQVCLGYLYRHRLGRAFAKPGHREPHSGRHLLRRRCRGFHPQYQRPWLWFGRGARCLRDPSRWAARVSVESREWGHPSQVSRADRCPDQIIITEE